MTDDGEALDAPVHDDVRSDEGPQREVPEAGTEWCETLSAELHKRALAPMSVDAIKRDLGCR
ncbi:hypothetical protein [Muricoccus nepalensis]|uniref:hypothetical protein n=1 Tax=Muricoccus nepalensis TaxID=1854500 RepID=UPI001129F70A|nr:hypothetical protein [Roseomonas nepalensis]